MLISMPTDTSTIFGVFQLIHSSQGLPIKDLQLAWRECRAEIEPRATSDAAQGARATAERAIFRSWARAFPSWTRSRRDRLARDRPHVTRSDHGGTLIIALFNSPFSGLPFAPGAARPRTAGHASVAGPPGNSSGCPAWRLRPVAKRSAGPASGAAYPATMLQRRRSRDLIVSVGECCFGVRAHAGGLAAALRRRSGTGILVCGTAHVAGPGPCRAGAKDDDGATGENQSFHVHTRLPLLLSRALTEQETKETGAVDAGSGWRREYRRCLIDAAIGTVINISSTGSPMGTLRKALLGSLFALHLQSA